jgi:predicted GTPase
MTWSQSLRRTLLRWDRVAVAGLTALPTLLLSLLGFFWLAEHGWLLIFLGVCVGLAAIAAGTRLWARRRLKSADPASAVPSDLSVRSGVDWSEKEKQVFREVRARIEAKTATARSWDALPQMAKEVVDEIATGLGERGALDFTVPEALLLVERTASRYRTRMRKRVPFADSFTIHSMQWFWLNRAYFQRAYDLATTGQRIIRMIANPPAGAMREIELMVSGGNASWLSEQSMGIAQAILLEEVAYSAVELYSGRLKFSDAELLDISLAERNADRARLAEPDAPIRILVLGQVSAGKSTLINALLNGDRAETDAAPTTPGFVTHEMVLDDTACILIDSRGLDGSDAAYASLLAEMRSADLILWAVRCNRPSRAVDQRLLHRFQASFDAEPERQRPFIVFAATWIDALLPGWPYPENHLPPAAQAMAGEVVLALSNDLGGLKPIPVCATSPSWNIDAVAAALAAHIGVAIKTQRNRRRLMGADRSGGVLSEIGRGGQGLAAGASLVGGLLLKRVFPGAPPSAGDER